MKKVRRYEIAQTDFKIYYRATVIKMGWYWFAKRQITYWADRRQFKINCVYRNLIYDEDSI